jgi:hypothetical protein
MILKNMKLFILNSQTATQIVGKFLASAFVLGITAFGLTSCNFDEDCEPAPNLNCSEKSAKAGALTATLKVGKTLCGVGKWGNLWLKADTTVAHLGQVMTCDTPPNGSTSPNMPVNSPNNPLTADPLRWLQPYSVEKGINYVPKEGETVRIVYEVVKNGGTYDNAVTCKAYMGRHIPIHILCIEPVNIAKTTNMQALTYFYFREHLKPAMNFNDIAAKFGKPAKDIGSGIHIYVYPLADGTEIWIGYAGKILYAKQVDKNRQIIQSII